MNNDDKNLFKIIALANVLDSDSDERAELMRDYDIDRDTAERAQEWIDEGLDEDEAVELAEKGGEI